MCLLKTRTVCFVLLLMVMSLMQMAESQKPNMCQGMVQQCCQGALSSKAVEDFRAQMAAMQAKLQILPELQTKVKQLPELQTKIQLLESIMKPFVSCGDPGIPSHGTRSGGKFTYGHTVRFSCNTGYRFSGSSNRTCQMSGIWSGTQAKCTLISCGNPGTPSHGSLYGSTFTYDSMVFFSCDTGYRLTGSSGRTCQATGRWSGIQTKCMAV